jgi:hypothetical protein
MKKIIVAILIVLFTPSFSVAATCADIGLYGFYLGNCPQYNPEIDLSIPVCDQPQWAHLAKYDPRCEVEVPKPVVWDKDCYGWDCPVPYANTFLRSDGRMKVIQTATVTEVDAHYRACRQSLGEALGK